MPARSEWFLDSTNAGADCEQKEDNEWGNELEQVAPHDVALDAPMSQIYSSNGFDKW
jgi:hypothetical protein